MIHDIYLDQRADLAAEAVVLRRLWRAVLVQALREAKGQIVNTGGAIPPGSRNLEQRRARDWIGSRDFREVCELAGFTLSAEEVLAAIDGPQGTVLDRNSRWQK
jgi:hypothetical protein